MLADDRMIMGVAGTAVGAVGAGLSVNELQAIVSIIVTLIGFTISVLIPAIVKIYKKIKEAKKDGVVTEEEKKEIQKEILDGSKEVITQGKEVIEQIKEQKENK